MTAIAPRLWHGCGTQILPGVRPGWRAVALVEVEEMPNRPNPPAAHPPFLAISETCPSGEDMSTLALRQRRSPDVLTSPAVA